MHALANRTTGGDISKLCNDINAFFHSVSSHLDPLPAPPATTERDVPNKYIISITEVEHVLMKTDTTKAPGPDGIPHDLAGLISKPICCIFNSSIREGSVPSCWKRADVVPIPKSNPPRSIESDLRPISLTPVLSKQLESFIGNWILETISGKIDVNQYGGLRGTSTTHALVDLLQNWHNIIHTNETVRILYVDFRKAFDSVNHAILLDRFRELGVHPILISWLHSFLHERQQRVKIGNEVSSWLNMKGAVPQGSWLGPLCFIVYVNKIEAEDGMRIHKYIDDITITEQIKHGEVSHLQKSLDTITGWCSGNSMRINGRKTKEMIVSFKKTKPEFDPITHEDVPLETVDHFKLLGVWVSNNMTWKHHVEHIYAVVSPRLYYLKQLRRCGVATEDQLMFYKSVIAPITEYACLAWHTSLTNNDTETLENIKKRAMSILFPGINYHEALKIAKLPTLSIRRDLLCKTFFMQVSKPESNLNYLLEKRNEHSYDLRHNQIYKIEIPRTERYKKSFIIHSLVHYT